MRFDTFSTILKEARFRQSSKQIIDQVKEMAHRYFNFYNSDNADIEKLIEEEKVVSFKDNKHYRKYFKHFNLKKMPVYFTPSDNLLGKITVLDLETNEEKSIDVYCVYGDIGDTEFAAYSQEYETINIYDNNIKVLSEQLVRTKILHEVTHGFQQYKGQSKMYQKMADREVPFDWDVYFKEPIEFDTHLNEIAYSINTKYKEFVKGILSTKELAVQKLLKMRLETFIKELKVFTESPLETYLDLKELPLPRYTETLEEFLQAINKDKKLWNKFKRKMQTLYTNLQARAVRILQRNSLINRNSTAIS